MALSKFAWSGCLRAHRPTCNYAAVVPAGHGQLAVLTKDDRMRRKPRWRVAEWLAAQAKPGRYPLLDRMGRQTNAAPTNGHEAHSRPQSPIEIAEAEGYFWGNAVSEAYFDAAERGFDIHWANIIAPMIAEIDYATALDLASGHGRNAQRLAEKAQLVYCVDINPENITFLNRRFAGDQRFVVVRNDGASLSFCGDSGIDRL